MAQTDYDIVVSGGGVAGLTAAAVFGSAGFSVLCVDPTPPVTARDADGSDLRTTAFLGWNLPNWLLRREMVAHLDSLPSVTFKPGTGTTTLFTREAEARVGLSDGASVRCRLVIAADGRNSPIRSAAGIDVKTTRYGQKALAFAVTHPIPHDNVSTEIHRSGGPFTLVPLPDHDGQPSSAIVWMEEGPEVARLAALPVPEFEAAMNARSCHLFGPLTLASRRTVWPIISQVAERMAAERVALVAEAAHVVPPIGAQGLNMHFEVQARVTGIDLLNRASMLSAQPLRDARAQALSAIYSLAPVRKTLMQMGLGARG